MNMNVTSQNSTEQQTADQVRTFFHVGAGEFDSIYSGNTSALMRGLNNWLRKDIYQRYEMTIAECAPTIAGKRVFDIGCGSGRYCHELAAKGAGECVGIDFADNMIEFANQFARQRGVAERCKFIKTGYLEYKPDGHFDVAIAMGYFDYIPDPAVHLRKMRSESDKLIAIFPVSGTARSVIRKVRLGLRGCPVFFYSPGQVKSLLQETGWRLTRLERVGQLWFVVAVAQ
jgi:2-polyprenyl-3-methyl-5-hydroxy-6-metoxy-1,4-benzoquinol methylase